MEAIAVGIENLEFITQLELKEILKVKSEISYPSRILFKVKDEKELAEFIYKSRSIRKAYLLLKFLKFESMPEIISSLKKIDFPYLEESFVVRCERNGSHNFSSNDIEKEAGEIIHNKYKVKVDLKNAKTTIIIDIINNQCYIGIDFTGESLSKRNYRIKLSNGSINACLAYCLLRIAEYESKDIILDPFCRSGEIPIEAALYSLNIPNFKSERFLFDKLIKTNFKEKKKLKKLKIYSIEQLQNNLRSAEVNARIISLQNHISFSRVDIEWLDTKFKENSIDKIITYPQFPTAIVTLKKLENIYKELFYHLEYIMKKKRKIVILTPCPEIIEKYASEYKFKKESEIKIKYLNRDFTILKFK